MALSADKLTLTYRFTNYGQVDGLELPDGLRPARRRSPARWARRSCRSAGSGSSRRSTQLRLAPGRADVDGIAADGYVAGDDAAAKQTVLDVVESVGFRPVDAGSLAAARTLEGMAEHQPAISSGTWQDAWVLVGPEPTAIATDDRN